MALGFEYLRNSFGLTSYNIRMTIPKLDACEELNAPEHLSSDVIVSALYVNNGKDAEEKSNRIEQITKKIGKEKVTYVMALLVLPQLIDDVVKTNMYKDFITERNQRTIH
jgi:hypothetical protein